MEPMPSDERDVNYHTACILVNILSGNADLSQKNLSLPVATEQTTSLSSDETANEISYSDDETATSSDVAVTGGC